jgi:hypothetical protein
LIRFIRDFDRDQSAWREPLPSWGIEPTGGTMSKAEIVVLAGIIGAFVIFAVGLAWVDFTTRRA